MSWLNNIDFKFWIPCLFTVIPALLAIGKYLYRRLKKERKRALLFENIECKQYIHKEHKTVELRVIYNKKMQYNALVILKARIKNIGKDDISKSTLVDPIKINCPNDYTIINATLINPNDKVRPTIKYSQQCVEVSWDLLKHGKDLEIEIIACINNLSENSELAIDFYNSLSIDINAEGIDVVDKNIELSKKEQVLRSRKRFFWIYFLAMLGCSIYLLFADSHNSIQHNIEYLIRKDSTTFVSTIGFAPHKNSLSLNNEIETSVKEFNASYDIIEIRDIAKATHSAKKNRTVSYWMCGTSLIAILLLVLFTYVEIYFLKRKKLQQKNDK